MEDFYFFSFGEEESNSYTIPKRDAFGIVLM
jgi:hypothetical protein